MNLLKQLTLAFMLVGGIQISAKNVEYVEDAYAVQAEPELVQQVNRVAGQVGFDGNYEVVIAKKPGLQINPWNRFIASGVNPATKNLFIMVNPQWLKTLSAAQQDFLIARCLVTQQQGGVLPKSVSFVPWIFVLLSLALWVGVFFGIRSIKFLTFTGLIKLPNWARIAVLVVLVIAVRLLVFDRVQANLIKVLANRHDVKIAQLTIKKMGDRTAAIEALKQFDAGIKAEVANGENALKPAENTFLNLAKDLEQPVCHHGHGCQH